LEDGALCSLANAFKEFLNNLPIKDGVNTQVRVLVVKRGAYFGTVDDLLCVIREVRKQWCVPIERWMGHVVEQEAHKRETK
jgi:arginine/lysine/ornithine decarboxylase